MSPRWPAWLLCTLAGPLAAQFAGTVQLEVPAAGLRFGAPFVLRCERQWPDGWTPQALDESAWAPLLVEVVHAEVQRTAAGGFVERREYRARAAARGELPAQDLVLRWRDGRGAEQSATMVRPALRVLSVLPEPPGDLEWAGPVRDLPAAVRWWWWLAGLGLALVGLRFVQQRRGARPAASMAGDSPATAPLPVSTEILAALAALPRPGADAAPALVAAFYVAQKALLRDYLARGAGLPAFVRSSEELLRLAPGGAAALGAYLRACDAVLFAGGQPGPVEHEAAHGLAVQFVRETAWGGAPGRSA